MSYAFKFGSQLITSETYGAGYLDELSNMATHALAAGNRILEWGSGVSTLMLADLLAKRGDGELVTIDDNGSYLQAVLAAMPSKRGVTALAADLTGARQGQDDLQLNYSSMPLALPPGWALIVIDGRRRMECAFAAALLADASTVVALHDYRRLRYQSVLGLYEVIDDQPQYRKMRVRPSVLAALAETRSVLMTRYRPENQPGLPKAAWNDIKVLCENA